MGLFHLAHKAVMEPVGACLLERAKMPGAKMKLRAEQSCGAGGLPHPASPGAPSRRGPARGAADGSGTPLPAPGTPLPAPGTPHPVPSTRLPAPGSSGDSGGPGWRHTLGAPPQRRSRHAGLPRATAGPGDDPVRKGRRARWRSSERKRPGEAMRPARRPTLPTRGEADKTRRSARPGVSSESHLDRRHLSKSTPAAHLPRKRGRGSQENRGTSLVAALRRYSCCSRARR